MESRLTVENALEQLEQVPDLFKTLFRHGSMEVEIYKPEKVDLQKPHSRDELYVIATGMGYFVHQGKRQAVEMGEVLFVPATEQHHFEDFSDDFSTWVIFYGPEGGEA